MAFELSDLGLLPSRCLLYGFCCLPGTLEERVADVRGWVPHLAAAFGGVNERGVPLLVWVVFTALGGVEERADVAGSCAFPILDGVEEHVDVFGGVFCLPLCVVSFMPRFIFVFDAVTLQLLKTSSTAHGFCGIVPLKKSLTRSDIASGIS